MEAVFAKLVSISIVANWLILAVILLRVLLKKAPRWITCILWALVAVRLVFPFSIESPVSLIPETTSVIQEAVDTNLIHPEVVPSDTAEFTTQEKLNRASEFYDIVETGIHTAKNIKKVEAMDKANGNPGDGSKTATQEYEDKMLQFSKEALTPSSTNGGDGK